ncbi:MAG: MBL fold metallo-hydrolase, partial [Verrucomicrobiota bacterium]
HANTLLVVAGGVNRIPTKKNTRLILKNSSRPSPPVAQPKLKVYCLGPGIGESIVLQLPCGGWGIVDCYQVDGGGTLEFLLQQKIKRLKFICFTHPHEDHYRGAHKLLDHYTGRIEQIWRFPGVSKKDLQNLGLAARARAKYVGDPEANGIANEYLLMLQSLTRERERLDKHTYRQLIAPHLLLEEKLYKIEVTEPGTPTVQAFQERLSRIFIKRCPMLLADEGGDLINSLSIVLAITFGAATVFLLGDAQGPDTVLDEKKPARYSLVKIAHHGSHNGLGAKILTRGNRNPHCVNHGIVTPYARSNLPRQDMLRKYEKACAKLIHTCPDLNSLPRRPVPGMSNARVPNKNITWIGIEVSGDGKIRRFQ